MGGWASRAECYAILQVAQLLGSGPKTVGSASGSSCEALEKLSGLHCYGLEEDAVQASAEDCAAECCNEDTCQAWQFHDVHGCWRGTPYACEVAASDFAKRSIGARIRNSSLGRTMWTGSLRTFNQLVTIEPYAEGPDEMVFQTHDLEVFRVRRFGSALEQVDVSNFCWKGERQPANCCQPRHSRATCYTDLQMHESCCGFIYGDGGEPWYTHYRLKEKEALQFFGSLFPSFEVDERAFEANRHRWRVGTHVADKVCSGGWTALTPSGTAESQEHEARKLDQNETMRGDVVEALSELVEMLSMCKEGPELSRTFINIGAGTCAWPDPLHAVLRSKAGRGFRGLAIEQNSLDLAKCDKNIPKDNHVEVHPILTAVMLPTVADVVSSIFDEHLHEPGFSPDDLRFALDILVVDIDAWDCRLVEELLQKMRPKIIIIEIAFHIPPPFRFSMQYDADSSQELLGNYDVREFMPASGCSLSYAVHAFKPHGYQLLRITGTDAMFVHNSAAPCLERTLGIRLPADEFSCYRHSRLWMQAPSVAVREWFFAQHPSLVFGAIWSNLTQMSVESGRSNQPFTLDY